MIRPQRLANEQDKDNFLKIGRVACLAHGAVATVLMTESWMLRPKEGKSPDLSIPPSQSPDRQEIVSIMGETCDGHAQKILPVLRSPEGKFMGFGETEEIKADQVLGRFSNFLSPVKPDREVIEPAQESFRRAVELQSRELDRRRGRNRGFSMG